MTDSVYVLKSVMGTGQTLTTSFPTAFGVALRTNFLVKRMLKAGGMSRTILVFAMISTILFSSKWICLDNKSRSRQFRRSLLYSMP